MAIAIATPPPHNGPADAGPSAHPGPAKAAPSPRPGPAKAAPSAHPVRSPFAGRGTRLAGLAPKSDNTGFRCTLGLGIMSGYGCNGTGCYPTLGPGQAACHGLGFSARGERPASYGSPQSAVPSPARNVSSDDSSRFLRFILLFHLPPSIYARSVPAVPRVRGRPGPRPPP